MVEETLFEDEAKDTNINSEEESNAPDVYEALIILTNAYLSSMEGNRSSNEEYQKRKEHASHIVNTASNQIASLRDEIFEYSQKLYNIKKLVDIKTWALSKQTQVFEKCLMLKNQSLKCQYQISLKEKEVLDFVRTY